MRLWRGIRVGPRRPWPAVPSKGSRAAFALLGLALQVRLLQQHRQRRGVQLSRLVIGIAHGIYDRARDAGGEIKDAGNSIETSSTILVGCLFMISSLKILILQLANPAIEPRVKYRGVLAFEFGIH